MSLKLNSSFLRYYPSIIKPFFDIITALGLFVVLFPLMLLIGLLLLIFQRGEVFFVQERVGKDEKIFKIFKFRTILSVLSSGQVVTTDEEGITPIGRVLRKYSLDELPQLLNVLLGHMSLVGPRPLLPEYLPLYSAEQKKRHSVKPGITGWAQVNGRNASTWTHRLSQDVFYVENMSFVLDCKILWLTFVQLFTTSNGDMPMQKFTGNN